MWLRRTPAPEDALHAGTPAWADLNEEERAEDNRRRAAARAKKGARLYAVANGLRFMWVLTWPDEVLLHGPDGYREAMRLVGLLVRRLREWNGEPLPYLYGAEVHPGRGGWHVNLLVGVRVPHELVWRLWRQVLGVDEGRGYVYVTDFFRRGQSVRASYRAAAGYAAKYVGKDFEDFGESRPAGAHRYEVAEGFRPEELRRWSAKPDVTWGMVIEAMDGEIPSEVLGLPGAGGRLARAAGEVGGMGGVTIQLEGLTDAQAALVRLLAVVEGIRSAEDRLPQLVAAAREAGVDGWTLANALGIDRSTLYRRYPVCSLSDRVS